MNIPGSIIRFSFASIILVGCQNNVIEEQPITFFHDAEMEHGWINTSTLTSFKDAYCGEKVSLTDSLNRKSIGYSDNLYRITKKHLREANVNARVYPEKGAQFSIVILITYEGKVLFSDKKDLSGAAPDEWNEAIALFKIPDIKEQRAILSSYVLNENGKKVLVDDFSLELK